MQLIAGRFQGEAEPRLGAEIERDLMRRARRGPGDRAGKAALDRAMKMAAENSLDLRVAADDLGKGRTAAEPGAVHPGDPGHKRRMVHQYQGGPIRRLREGVVDPAQPVGTEEPAAFARHQGVERDDAHRVVVDHIVEEAPLGADTRRRQRPSRIGSRASWLPGIANTGMRSGARRARK